TRQGTNVIMTPESIQAMIDHALQRNSTHTQNDESQSSGGGLRRPVQPAPYTQRFQELALMCTKFLADETKHIENYISGFPDNIHGNVMSARPKTLDDAIELANDLMDQKLRTYAERQNDNKRKADDSLRNNQQQQPHKKQNVSRAYTAGPGACYECGNTGHIKKNCPKLKNHRNGNRDGVAQGRAYVLGGRDASLNSNVITGMIVAQQADDVADEVAAGVNDVPAVDAKPFLPSPTPTTQPPPPIQELPSISQGQEVREEEQGESVCVKKIEKDKDVILEEVDAEKDDKEIEKDADVQGRPKESQAQIYKIDLEHADKVLSMQDDELEPSVLKEVVEVVTTAKLITEVVIAAVTIITVATTPVTAAIITAAIITAAFSAARRRKRVVIRDPEETATPSIIIHSKPKSKDKGKGIIVKEPKPLKKQG
nr:hypothetical protein [Tanacetum cinerariifolium]